MTKQLKWRLGKLPTPDEVLKLVNDKLITKEEARDILFNEESTEEPDTESLKSEIKFLRELVEKLSNKTQLVETIRYIKQPYYNYDWYKPYQLYCTAGSQLSNYSTVASLSLNSLTGTSLGGSIEKFTDIQTF